MKKLFISQPMKGKSDEDILKERNKAIAEAERLCDDVVEVLDSFFQGAPADAKPLWFLGEVSGGTVPGGCRVFRPGMGRRERVPDRAPVCGRLRHRSHRIEVRHVSACVRYTL